MGQELESKSVLLTGASSGIGAATAVALGEAGARLGLLARRLDRLGEVGEAAIAAGAPEVELFQCDLADLEAAQHSAMAAEQHFGGVDVLINNAGMPKRRSVQDLTMADLDLTMDVNFRAPMALTMALLPAMLKRGSGTIVNVSSVGGRLPVKNESAYCASKAAMCGFTESMAADLYGTGVEVRLILPGPIDTEIWDQPDNDDPFFKDRLNPPTLVADGIVEAIRSDLIEHYLPDLSELVAFKNSDLEGFISGMVDMAADQ